MGPRSHVTTAHKLLTSSWTSEVEALETAVARFNEDRPVTNDCLVAFFEIARDDQLHVNVTHKYPTRTAPGWAGPARVPDGFVHNRRFGDAPRIKIARHVRDMVFSARIRKQPATT